MAGIAKRHAGERWAKLSTNPGAALPVIIAAIAPTAMLSGLVTASALLLLVVLGALAARVGGAGMVRGALRVAFWGALAMAISAGVGRLFGTVVA